MAYIQYQVIRPGDNENIELISGWYLNEWGIPVNTTIEKIKSLSLKHFEFQVFMTLDDIPIGAGGLYTHVGLLEREPRFKIY